MAAFATFYHGTMTGIEITCIQSFLDHGHDIEVFAYGDCGAPSHFKVVDAARILNKRSLFYYKSGPGRGSVSGFTNRFRYALLAGADTWWVDSDVICLRKDWPDPQTPICAAWEDEERIGNAVLRIARSLAAELRDSAVSLGKRVRWGQTGPELVTQVVRSNDLVAGILPSATFYPVHYGEWAKAFMPDFKSHICEAARSSYALHLWNEMGRRVQFDKTCLPDRNSYFGALVEQHQTAKYFRAAGQPKPPGGGGFRWRSLLPFLR